MWGRSKGGVQHRFGIRFRVASAAALVVALTLVVSCAVLVGLMQQSLVTGLDATQLARAQDIAAQASPADRHGVVPSTAKDSSAVQIIDASGRVVASTANLDGEDPILRRPPAARHTTATTLADSPLDAGGQFRVTAQPITLSTGAGWIYVATSLAQVDRAINSLITLFTIGLPIIVIIVALIAALAVRQSLQPVEAIRRRADAIGAADLSQRVPVPAGSDEITHLAATMNDMLGRLEIAATRQQQFIGDASHELRSPLTALAAQVDVALAHPEDAASQADLAKMRAQVTRMSMLIEDLLFLARSTEGAPLVLPAPVDLDELVLAEAERLRERGEIDVHVATLDAARVNGSMRDLARALRNLGDNAYDHANARITLTLVTIGRTAQLTVADDGPGVALENRERIFSRFSRLDDARERNSRGGGSGLGLSITRHIVETIGGTITVNDRLDGNSGAAFVMRIPLEP